MKVKKHPTIANIGVSQRATNVSINWRTANIDIARWKIARTGNEDQQRAKVSGANKEKNNWWPILVKVESD